MTGKYGVIHIKILHYLYGDVIMKKTISALCALLIIAALFTACANPPQVEESSAEPVSEASEIGISYEEPVSEEASAVPVDERAVFVAQAKKLIEKDAYLTELLIMGGIYADEPETDDIYTALPLSEANPYALSLSVMLELSATYTESAIEEILSYPEYGTPTVVLSGKRTCCSRHFTPQRGVPLAPRTAEIVAFGGDTAVLSVQDALGEGHTLSFTLTENGWRLDRMYYFASRVNASSPELTASYAGSASALRGKCLVVNIFLNDGESSWKENDIAESLSRLGKALDFLSAECASYGAQVEFTASDITYSPRLSTSEKVPSDMENTIWIDLLFGKTVFGSLQGYVNDQFDTASYDNYCVLIHINKQGRCYSLYCDRANYDWQFYNCERAVIYHTDDTSYVYCDYPAVYAHEILHLFGATDLYGEYVSDEAASIIEHYFPNDIMHSVGSDLGFFAVSPYTAYASGMTSALHEQFVAVSEDKG